ncbi:NusA antitermination factor [Longilinea arvoryzae]|uniref:Transcription termination/antitermination protein NusA n=1 Tax=Longilinea arvoryzae TaxID=360412 RepID=A0A0S7BKB1_9CHLR|nr:transcription termination factor NusA [Longilinea arvoryzae]GAP14090.1 NusA antitermination factor [Longilinea arvoryzae]
MKNEFTLAFNEVLEEKQLPREIILKALESAMISAYRRAVNASNAQHIEATVDTETGKVTIFAEKEVVEDVQDVRTEVALEEAHRYNPEAVLGDMVVVESTPNDFGRVAAQTARQVIQQRIRDAERQAQLAFFNKQLGEIVSGLVQAVNAQGLTIGMDMKAEGTMPRKEMIPGERFRIHDRVRALISEVKDSPRGPQIILSRTHRNFLRRLLETEVPEIYHGVVEIRSIAREPGERAKVAVSATQTGIDPVGACVGIRGVRIQAIVRELHDEKIDVIEWNPDPAAFIAKAISPARVTGVYLNERATGGKTATVVVPEDQLSLAIGRDGQNARLAAKLTGWRIDIKSLPEAVSDTLYRLQNEPVLLSIADSEVDTIARIEESLARKADGRPLTPEEYDIMAHFVDRVEKRTAHKPEKKVEVVASEVDELIPADAFETAILDGPLPEHVANLLQEAGYATVGEVARQMKQSPDDVLRINGIGPKAMAEIIKMMDDLDARVAAAKAETAPVEETKAPEAEAMQAVESTEGEATAEKPAEAETKETTVEEPPIRAIPEPELVTPVLEEEPSLEDLFTMRPEILSNPEVAEEEEEEVDSAGNKTGKKKSKKKRKSVEVVYDPERDLTLARKKHKRGTDGWDWE